MSENLKEIAKKLNENRLDIQAEIVLDQVLKTKKLRVEDISIHNKGTFMRSYRRDVFKTTGNNETGTLDVQLVRNGIYDGLPRGLFHETIKHDTEKSFNEIRQQGKREERSARKLFAPLENEFFIQKLLIQREENKLTTDLSNSESSFLLDIWGLKNRVDTSYVFLLTNLLPLAHRISKDKILIAKALEEILNEKVSITKKWETLKNKNIPKQEDEILGVNTILEVKETNYKMPTYVIHILLDNPLDYEKYLKNGICYNLISVFCEYFVPLEIEWRLSVSTSKNENYFTLDSSESAVLGLATTI